MSAYRIVEELRKGAEFPSWLIDCEPRCADAIRADLIAAVDCAVIETPVGYFIVPGELSPPAVLRIDGRDNVIFAAARAVVLPLRVQVLTGEPPPPKPEGIVA